MQQLQRYKKTELGEIPEDWNIFRLEEVCSIRKNNNPRSDLYIGLEHIGQGNNQLISKGDIRDFTSNKNAFLKGDVLYGKLRPLLNKVYLAEADGYCSTDILPLVSNDKISNKILLWALTSERFVNYADANSSGTKMPRTNWNDMKNFLIPLGKIDEQQKIASILSNVDELIQKTDQIIEQTQRLKKGLMQRLLTKGIGHTKFKKTDLGHIPEEWEISSINSFLVINMGQSPPSETYNDKKEGLPFYQGVSDFGELFPTSRIWCSNSKKIADKNQILFSVRAPVGEINITNEKCCIGRGISSLIPIKSDLKYCFYLLKLFKNKFISYSQGSTFDAINRDEIGKVKLPFTSNIEEQQKIASILSNVDELIQRQKINKSNLENLKKGLMQQLLTGKIRVKV